MMSLRNSIDTFCKVCTYYNKAPGTWRQQVTLCGAKNCSLYDVRPKTTHPIPKSVGGWYGVNLVISQSLKANSGHS